LVWQSLPRLPPTLAPFVDGLRHAEDASDRTGVNKALFELGLAIPRHALGVGLAELAPRLDGRAAPAGLAVELRRALRLSHGRWLELVRAVEQALDEVGSPSAKRLDFARSREASELVRARNEFAHGAKSGEEAPALVAALLTRAQALLEWSPAQGWDEGARPWLPRLEGQWGLPDPPHVEGQPWRVWLPSSGEHRPDAELDRALRALSGRSGPRPVLPTSRPALVGRAAELSRIAQLAGEARQGGVRLAALLGGGGWGRSRLAEELLAHSGPLLGIERAVASACASHQRGALRSLSLALEDAVGLEEVSAAVSAARSPLVAQNPAALGAALESVEEALIRSTIARPLLWVIDDAQWLDERTLELLLLLTDRASRSTRGQLLVVATFLGPSGAAWHKLSQHPAFAARRGAAVLSLPSLSRETAAELARNVAPLSEAVVERVVALAAGVPRFIVEPVVGWHELGRLTWEDGVWHAAPEVLGELPPAARDTLEASLRSHFDPESPAARAAEAALAVAALDVAPSPYARVLSATCSSGHEPATVRSALETLLGIGIFSRPAPSLLSFAQPLLHEAARERAEASASWHLALSALLDAIGAEPGAAQHALRLAQGYQKLQRPERAAEHARVAFGEAMREGAFERAHEAALLLEISALGAEAALEAALARADARRALGDFSGARELLLRLDPNCASPRGRLRARILTAVVRDALRDPDAVDGLRLVNDADLFADPQLRLDARLAVARMVGGEDGLRLADEAVGLAEGFDLARRYLARDVRAVVGHLQPRPDLDKLREDVACAGELAAAADVAWMSIESAMNLAVLLAETEPARALESFVELLERAKAAGLRSLTRVLLVNVSVIRQRVGDHAGSASSAREASDAAREAGDRGAEGAALGLLADALLATGGEPREALNAAEASLALKRNDASVSLAWLRCSRAQRALGALDEAESAAAAAVEAARNKPFQDLEQRAELWQALLRFERGATGAAAELERATRAVEAMGHAARPPARALALEARKLLS